MLKKIFQKIFKVKPHTIIAGVRSYAFTNRDPVSGDGVSGDRLEGAYFVGPKGLTNRKTDVQIFISTGAITGHRLNVVKNGLVTQSVEI